MTTHTDTASIPEPDIPSRVRRAVEVALDKLAMDLLVLHLGKVTDFTEYFLIANGNSERQVAAIADGIEQALRSEGVRPLAIEGLPRAQWALLDYGDFVVHLFTEAQRRHYLLERLWADAPDVTGEFAPAPTAVN